MLSIEGRRERERARGSLRLRHNLW